MFLGKGSYELPKNNDRVFCINYKHYVITELAFREELILIKQVHLKSVTFVTIGIFR